MYKNQLQELAQRSCFNLPSYTSTREGPDHAPRFKSAVNFNGETFESPSYCSTLRQAEHSAAEMALNALSGRGPSYSLAARILDETGVYKNLLQEVSQRVGASLPAYTTFRTGLGHLPVFICTVELAGVIFTGESAKNKKQAEKNAAMSAWLSLKTLLQQSESLTSEKPHKDEPEHVNVARALQKYLIKSKLTKVPFPIKFPTLNPRPSTTQPSAAASSKILPFIFPKTPLRNNKPAPPINNTSFQNIIKMIQTHQISPSKNEIQSPLADNLDKTHAQKFPALCAPPYIPIRHHRTAPPVTIRNSIAVFAAPPFPSTQSSIMRGPPGLVMAPPMCVRQAVPVRGGVTEEDLRLLGRQAGRGEDLPISRGSKGGAAFSKVPLVRFDEPLGYKSLPAHIAPNFEVQSVQAEVPFSEIPKGEVKLPDSQPVHESAGTED
ncbi:hypothetical protein OROGR_016204 [Orobanche gracilis]